MSPLKSLVCLCAMVLSVVMSEPCIDISLLHLTPGCHVEEQYSMCYNVSSLEEIRNSVQTDELLIVDCDIDVFNLRDFPEQIRKIAIIGGTINKVEGEAYKTLPHLEALSVVNNKAKEIDPNLFYGATSLTRLYLENSPSPNVLLHSFAEQQALLKLEINNNKVTQLVPEVFAGLQNLQTLSLRENPLVGIAPSTFAEMNSLEVLDLDNCEIAHLEDKSFDGLGNLKELILSNNKLEALGPGIFNHELAALQYLYLSGNLLETVELGTFHELPLLKVLSLDNNRIAHLEMGVFDGLANVRLISIMGNMITELSPEIIVTLPTLSVFQLDHSLKHMFKEYESHPEAVAIVANGIYEKKYC